MLNFKQPRRLTLATLSASNSKSTFLTKRELAAREERRSAWKRDLSLRPNGTLDPFYGCLLWDEMWQYALNFTFPWCLCYLHCQILD